MELLNIAGLSTNMASANTIAKAGVFFMTSSLVFLIIKR
jgi:hypothetical protein